MNENLINQIVVALLQDGTIKLTAEQIASVLASPLASLAVQYRFKGVVQPGIAPGRILTPTLYVAVAGGWYPGFSKHQVNEGQIIFLTSSNGAYWDKVIAYDGVSPIPSGSKNYLTIEATQDSTAVSFMCSDISIAKTIEVSTDGETWTEKTSSTSGTALATLNTGEKLYLRGENAAYGDTNGMNAFFADKPSYLYGNIMSLIGGENFEELDSVGEAAFANLFDGSNGAWVLSKADEPLVLPALTLGTACYLGMFYNQNLMTTAPELPATTLAVSCYQDMFNGCTSLASVTCLATDISASHATFEWLDSVAESGTFTKAAGVNWSTGISGIPTGWTTQEA